MKRLVLAMTILAVTAAIVQAQTPSVPQLVNYQGQLTDVNGVPLPNGSNYMMEFNIYNAKTGGALLWGPMVFDNLSGNGHASKVTLASGYFNVYLGPKDTAARDISVAFAQATTFLGIKVTTGSTLTGVPELVPRQQLLSAPYALQAGDADSLGAQSVKLSGSNLMINKGTVVGSGYGSNTPPTNGALIEGAVGIGTGSTALGTNKIRVEGNGLINGILGLLSGRIGTSYLSATPPTEGLIVSGNVGIGTNNPGTNKLQVEGTTRINGNVGLGADAGSNKLLVSGAATVNGTLGATNAKVGSGYAGNTPPTDGLIVQGNVGIGTNNPGTNKLDVTGNARISGGALTVSSITGPTTVTGALASVVGTQKFYMVPKGAIIMWSGTLANIPSGWQLCDGTNGTPDLRQRFIIGVLSGQNPGGTGGSWTHIHGVDIPAFNSGTYAGDRGYIAGTDNDGITYGHYHSVNPPYTDTTSANHTPPYYALAFIMKL